MEASYGTLSASAEEASQQFVGQWFRLVSTTNWEKGRIIAEWRQALIEADAPVNEYSDEAWSRRIGQVSSQHTGRLRRTFARFGATFQDYQGLYWSHFQAALDWDDAEMWLEGAAQNAWSISEMRKKRVETLGLSAAEADIAEVVSEELDEDAGEPTAVDEVPRSLSPKSEVISDEADLEDESEDSDADEDDDHYDDGTEATGDYVAEASGISAEASAVRPFARLADLPDDLSDAFESFKLAILRHKLAGWSEVARDDVVGALRSLEQLAMAPSD